ncbi:hypothetical protein HIM_03068 [Hirsutella minnesotensis 3608]|nr:hypothetical protein HIM_03068 [Hirsutella minnesotensis 3608]
MADHHVMRPPAIRGGPSTPDDPSRRSYDDAGTSSTADSLTPMDTAYRQSADGDATREPPLLSHSGFEVDGSRRRRNKNRSSGGFLLRDSVASARERLSRRSVRDAGHTNSEGSRTSARPDGGVVSSSDVDWAPSTMSSRYSQTKSSVASDDVATDDTTQRSSTQQDAAELDVDSAQIVNMALNLSESRRIASQRNAQRGTPPRLAPIPDGSSAGQLRQHLQQQRRSSRNPSPRPKLSTSSRISSSMRIGGPRLFVPDAAVLDTQYRYHFSPSTLARAQKAKEHFELMAEYRRLLDVLQPLKPIGLERNRTASPPASPVGGKSARMDLQPDASPLGREYNPLQYIRNRKVRARERKVIDGESQGFHDVEGVRIWVDKVRQQLTTHQTFSEDAGDSHIPAFPGADALQCQDPSESAVSRAAPRARRPRVDWFMEPCDMVADAYWLEQDHHKHLIEDRQWRKIFPPAADISSPMSRDHAFPDHATQPLSLEGVVAPDAKAHSTAQTESELSLQRTRDRAIQKFQNIKTFPHRHDGPSHAHHHHHHHYDLRRLGKDSYSDLSGSDGDHNELGREARHAWTGTISSNTNDLLEKQMMEMIAKETREQELTDAVMDEEQATNFPSLLSPESRYFRSRRGSTADTSDSDRRYVLGKASIASQLRQGPSQRTHDLTDSSANRSAERISSYAPSPELLPVKRNSAEAGVHSPPFSPSWSRSGSPARNPLNKIRSMMRDKHSDTSDGVPSVEPSNEGNRQTSAPDPMPPPPPPEKAGVLRRRTSSPAKRFSPHRPPDMSRGHRRSGSLLQRLEDPGNGLRGMFKGPRIDTVIRGGVSRLSDMLWRKEGSGSGDPSLEVESTDESDSERARGRGRSSPVRDGQLPHMTGEPKRPEKHFLDLMPEFSHAPGFQSHTAGDGKPLDEKRNGVVTTKSSRSSHNELLKAEGQGNANTSRSGSPLPPKRLRGVDSDVAKTESRQDSIVEEALQVPNEGVDQTTEAKASEGLDAKPNWQWSIAHSSSPAATTQLSRRELARMKALILSSGIKAMEISRRANETCRPFSEEIITATAKPLWVSRAGVDWADVARLSPEKAQLQAHQVAFCELYPLAAKTLAGAIQASGQRWQLSADKLANQTAPAVQKRIGELRSRLVDDLSEMTRTAANEADETSRDLALGQPLKVKHVTDTIEKMLRRRRRRLRWVRRALWLMVEWLLVGLMWYVWFVVMIFRVFLGLGKGVWKGVRWLLWLQ